MCRASSLVDPAPTRSAPSRCLRRAVPRRRAALAVRLHPPDQPRVGLSVYRLSTVATVVLLSDKIPRRCEMLAAAAALLCCISGRIVVRPLPSFSQPAAVV